MLKKLLVGTGVSVFAFSASTTSAWAFYCGVADKPQGAGAAKGLTEPLVNPAGRAYYPGAFYNVDGQDVFVRGSDYHEDSFGAANPKALENGPADHGVVYVY